MSVKTRSLLVSLSLAVVVMVGAIVAILFSARSSRAAWQNTGYFQRIATFDASGSVAEIVAATADGRTLIYTNSADRRIGFVDISNPAAPIEISLLDAGGEPTSVATTPDGRWALVVVDAAPDKLIVIDLSDRTLEATINLGGQPDSITISPDGRYAAIAIENERDESLNDGRLPQAPAGFLTIVDLLGAPTAWTTRNVALTGLAARFPEDPEPEFVDINAANQAVVTLQENNHVVIVNLANGQIIAHWTAGTTTHAADIINNGDINFSNQINNARREPDTIVWTPGGRLLTANEGDYTVDLMGGFAGGRDFTIFNQAGGVVFEPGADLEIAAARSGHYADSRSPSKGIEPEGAEVGVYNGRPFAFIASERGDFVAVYDISDETRPQLRQLLPTGDAPEGLLALPQRNLLVSANEGDGSLSIYQFDANATQPDYPQITSENIFWGALSGLALGADNKLYAVPDSIFRPSRIYTITPGQPAQVVSALTLGRNYDLEGIAIRPEGGWWVVSEGAGNAGATGATKNLLVQVNADGTIAREIELPASVNAQQVQFGFEGVATSADGAQIYVAFQREWAGDPARLVRIGRYTPATGEWAFYHYPIEAAPNATAWVGLSELTRINDTTFAVLERDNQLRENARIKRIYTFSIAGLTPVAAGAPPPVVTKTLVRDLYTQDGFLLEKAEGLTVTPLGDFIVASDNDGGGETRLLTVLNQSFDACLQDDQSGDVLRYNARTGEYALVRCGAQGFVLTGRAAVRRVGSELRLKDFRLNLVVEEGFYSVVSRGQAVMRVNPLAPTFTLDDSNLSDNNCLCR